MKTIFSVIILIFLLAACDVPLQPNEAKIKIFSNPPGATLQSGSATSPAPKEWIWKVDTRGIGTAVVTATWVSGARTTVRLNLHPGTSGTYTIQRPNVPGLDADIKWAIHLEQKERASQDAFAAALHNYNESNERARQDAQQPSRFINCTSTKNGNSVDTTCF